MVSGLRPFLVFFCLGQGLLLWWTAGQYDPAPGEANEPPPKAARPMAKFPSSTGFSATATVDTAAASYPIRDEIFGVCDWPPEKLAVYGIPAVRWGGNRSSRFNYEMNADSAGKDWFFKNGGTPVSDPAHGGYVKFLRDRRAVGATGYLTVPTLGFVAKDHSSHAFSVRKYGPQRGTEMGQPDIGNGVRPDGTFITDNDGRDTSVAVGPDFVAASVRLVVEHAGRLPGVRYWALDNEPMLWHETHRDVRRTPVTYDELWATTVRYAEAIKAADPSAKVAGFCSAGWTDLFYSAADEGGDGYRSLPDHAAHGRVPLAEWFIRKCGDYQKDHGKTLVDVFDFHWYPQAECDGRTPYTGSGIDPAFNRLRLRTTRDLWDPAYQPESWTKGSAGGGPTMILRRIRAWIAEQNPGMELCIGEYNFGGADNVTGALAQADVFGILARERADLAFLWHAPEGTQELAWQLFRNYDGRGGRFGDRHIPATSGHADVAIHAAKRTRDGATTLVVLNQNLGGPCKLSLEVPGLNGKVRLWRFDQEDRGQVVEIESEAKATEGRVTLTLPPASGTMIVVE